MRRRLGQVSTEYMMAISVVVVASVAAGWRLYEPLREGFQSFGQRFETYFAEPPPPFP